MTSRRTLIRAAAALPAALGLPGIVRAQGAPVRVGYAIARTGPWTGGAQVSQEPNYMLWAEQVNAAGGLSVKGSSRQVELISYDDRSEVETCVRTFEKLMGSDKVDLILPPWGTTANFAVAPLANRFGYPLLAPTALAGALIEMKLPYFFSMLQQPKLMMDAVVDMLAANGVKTIAVIYMDDLFGLENFAALKPAVKAKGIEIVDNKSYPLGIKDLAPVLRGIKDKNPTPSSASPTRPTRSWPAGRARRSASTRSSSTPRSAPRSSSTAGHGRRRRGGHRHRIVEREDEPRRQGVLRRPRQEVRFQKEPDRWASAPCWAGLEIIRRRSRRSAWTARRSATTSRTTSTARSSETVRSVARTQHPGTVSQWRRATSRSSGPRSPPRRPIGRQARPGREARSDVGRRLARAVASGAYHRRDLCVGRDGLNLQYGLMRILNVVARRVPDARGVFVNWAHIRARI